MPITFEIRPEAIWFRTRGDVGYEEGLDVLRVAIAAAQERDPKGHWPLVFDIRESAEDRSAGELEGIAAFLVEHGGGVVEPRCAVVAGDDLHYGLARMFEAYAGSRDLSVAVLRSVDDVPGWLAGPPA